MSYTPGPWSCRESALSRASDLWFVDGPRPDEADMHGEARAPRVAEVWTAANARLIAAAPELLAALRRAVDTIHAWHDIPGGGTLSEADKATAWRIYRTHAPEMQAINAAIAKAEGLHDC